MMRYFLDDPWDVEEEIVRFIDHQFRNIPGVGVGEGMIYDGTELLLMMILEEENLAKEKAFQMSNYAVPFPGGREAVQIIGQAIKE